MSPSVRRRRNRQVGLYAELGPRPGIEGYPAVFTLSGQSTHLLGVLASPNHNVPSLCGRWPNQLGMWMGTGDEDEYDIARSMPLCTTCSFIASVQTDIVSRIAEEVGNGR